MLNGVRSPIFLRKKQSGSNLFLFFLPPGFLSFTNKCQRELCLLQKDRWWTGLWEISMGPLQRLSVSFPEQVTFLSDSLWMGANSPLFFAPFSSYSNLDCPVVGPYIKCLVMISFFVYFLTEFNYTLLQHIYIYFCCNVMFGQFN